MTDIKSAEQQVRETLGWRTYCPTAPHEVRVFNLAISKTAELLEMTSQRDEAQKALEIARANGEVEYRIVEKIWEIFGPPTYKELGGRSLYDLISDAKSRAESAEATIREQAERIKELEETLALVQSLSSQIWDAAEVAWKEEKTETEASNER